jgi:hypothetical protein
LKRFHRITATTRSPASQSRLACRQDLHAVAIPSLNRIRPVEAQRGRVVPFKAARDSRYGLAIRRHSCCAERLA